MAGHTLTDLSLEQLAALPAAAKRVALLPMGSLEQHGPHLPLGTDSIIATSLAKLVAEKTGAMLLPELPFTWAGGTRTYPVAINIHNQVVIDMLLLASCRHLVVVRHLHPADVPVHGAGVVLLHEAQTFRSPFTLEKKPVFLASTV